MSVSIETLQVLLHLFLVNRVHKRVQVGIFDCLNSQSPTTLTSTGASQFHAVDSIFRVLQDSSECLSNIGRIKHRVLEPVVSLVSSFSESPCVPEHGSADSSIQDVHAIVWLVTEMREYNDGDT